MIELIRKFYPHYQVSDPITEYPAWRVVDGYLMKWKFDVHAIYYACQKCKMFYDRVAVEIDTPYKGHGTRLTIKHDNFRDKFFMENDCIRTVRLNTRYVWGRKKMPDDVILAELDFIKRSSRECSAIPRKNSNI